jgi:hypothetical protein
LGRRNSFSEKPNFFDLVPELGGDQGRGFDDPGSG